MSRVYVISDLHLSHKNIMKFAGKYRNWCSTVDEHDWGLISRIRSVCRNKRDHLYILGDVCMDLDKMELLNEIPAKKFLIRGNHDDFPLEVYTKYFDNIFGLYRYKGFWMSHSPIHPCELRGKKNIHGHVHQNSIQQRVVSNVGIEYDPRYINVCVENCEGYPINMQEIREGTFKGVIS